MEINWKPVEPPVYQRGDLYETKSVECGYTELYRWINMNISTDWICDGTTKYYKQKKQVSFDEGVTWQDVIPYEYQRGSVYETQSTDCGYSPDIKFILTYSDGSTFIKYCNEYSYILGSEVMEGGQKSEITEIFIGSCVRGVDTNAFNGVCKLKRVNSNVDGVMNIPEGVLEIGENAFTWTCSSCHITSITLPSTLQRLSIDSFDSISCHQTLTINAVTPPYMYLDEYEYFPNPIYVPCQSVSAYKTASGWSNFKDYIYGMPPCAQPKLILSYSDGRTYSKECDGYSSIGSPDTNPSGYEYSAMTTAIIGDCITTIGNSAFYEYRRLRYVYLPNSVTYINSFAFNGCSRLTSIGLKGSGASIEMPNSVTRIAHASFANCSGLTSVIIPTGVTSISDMVFANCTSLASVTIPNSVTTIGNSSFSDCTSLTSIVIPDGVTTIDGYAFNDCTSLTSINIPSGVTSIGENAFNNTPWWNTYSADTSHHYGNIIYINDIAYKATSSGITSCTFRDGTVSIGELAFVDCTGLTSITIPDTITTIGKYAFISCTSLTGVTVNAVNPPTLGEYTFDNTNNCPIYVPASSLESYKSASGWSQYANRIFPIT